MQEIISIDEQVLLAINSCNNGYWDIFMYWVSDKWIWIPFYLSILYAVYRNYGLRTMLLVVLTIALAITATDQICSHLIRPMVHRMRPSNLNNPISEFVHIVNGYRGGRYGFPSSHAGNTFAAAMFTALLLRNRRYTLFIFLWAVIVCYSRIYLGVHYPGDILTGMTIGILVGWLFFLLATIFVDHLNRKGKFLLTDFGKSVKSTNRLKATDIPILTGVLTFLVIAIVSL